MKVQVNGKSIFFDVEGPQYVPDGEGGLKRLPTLIAIHGSPGNSDHSVFKPDFSALRDVAQVIYLDLSGAGRSDDEPDGVFSLERWSDDLVAFCEVLAIEKPVILGVSAGGYVTMMHGIRHPDHAAKLIVASSQAFLDVPRSLAEFKRVGGDEVERVARVLLTEKVNGETSLAFGRVCMPFYNTSPQPPRSAIIFRPKLAMAFHKLDGIWHKMDLRPELHRISVPTLVLAGDTDPITPLQDSLDIAAALDPAIVTLEVIENAGHGPWRDQPEPSYRALRAFLAA